MSEDLGETHSLLLDARRRGQKAVGSTVLPPGLDQFTAYVGLISSALELGKLIQTEERDLKAIESHHQLEMARIDTAFRQIEIEMLASFQADNSLRDKTFESINLLISKGHAEIALKFYERMLDGFKRPSLEAIIESRNAAAPNASGRMKFK